VGHAPRSGGLFRLEASRARVSQSSLKTGGGVAQMVHVASSQNGTKDRRFDGVGCGAVEVRPIYPSLVVIFLLAHRGILVFWFSL
jgi:hypothetical protein